MEIAVKTNPKYRIIIQKGLIKNNKLPQGFVITDSNVYEKYRDLVGDNYFCINAGEKSKNIETYFKILDKLKDSENIDTITAFGGGVVGDTAGFVASTYKRGVKLIQIPTSLLAMVDSSIGGKNGVNLGEKKNYIGTIYQPTEVIIDTSFLETLPKEELKNGFAEIIKYYWLFDKNKLKEKLDLENIEKIIFECCKYKVNVIEKDTFDKSYRHVLNFGHTIGHAIELLNNLSHGEAISIGMIKEMELGEKIGLIKHEETDMLRKALKSAGLPTELPKNIDIQKIIEIMKSDKKGKFRFAFSREKYDVEVEEDKVIEFLKGEI